MQRRRALNRKLQKVKKTELSDKRKLLNKYQEAYEDLRQKDPIASMDERVTEYPSKDYHQLDKLIEERRTIKE